MFLYPALTAGFLFVGVPLLVHLINMLRHRRQPWAAMDFLLVSYRKQKKWIILRQLLLLLARLTVAVLLIAMLCGWTSRLGWLGTFGSRSVHHVVVLDDSYSMADVSGGGTAYGRVLGGLQTFVDRLATTEGQHQLTILRSSRAALVQGESSASADAAADIVVQTITGDSRLIQRVISTAPSAMSADLLPAVQLASDLIGNRPADQTVLYMLSDFRQRDWQNPERIAEVLRQLSADGVQLRCIDAAANPSPNLGITRLQPVADVWVAGVPVVMQVAIKNHSNTAVTNLNVAARVIRYGGEAVTPDPTRLFSGAVENLPGLMIERLEPGEEVVRQFQVFVSEPGTHAVQVTLPEDALAADNSRICTLPLTDAERVLVIDGDPDGLGAYHVAAVLDPGSQVRTGAIPDVRPFRFLRSATAEDLEGFRAIFVINPEELTQNSAAALSEYVRGGGGLAWFLGRQAQAPALNDVLLAEDRNLLPGSLVAPADLSPDDDGGSTDVVLVDSHPLTEPLEPLGNSVFGRVGVVRSWVIDATDPRLSIQFPSRRVLDRRDGRPFVVQHRVGQGNVVTVLAGLEGEWSNWKGDPTFVIFMLRTNAFLWSGRTIQTQRQVDDPIRLQLPDQRYANTVRYLPAALDPPRVSAELTAEKGADQWNLTLDPREAVLSGDADLDSMLTPGLTEIWVSRLDSGTEVRTFAAAVAPAGGDLRRVDQAKLQRDLQPIALQFSSTDELRQETGPPGSGISLLLLAMLGTMLAGEQALAYWASYHPPRTRGGA